jgi:hypothetical protein
VDVRKAEGAAEGVGEERNAQAGLSGEAVAAKLRDLGGGGAALAFDPLRHAGTPFMAG